MLKVNIPFLNFFIFTLRENFLKLCLESIFLWLEKEKGCKSVLQPVNLKI